MNARDILMYGQHAVLASIDGLPEEARDVPGACGVWSVKDIIAHLASFECLLLDVINDVSGGGPTAYLDAYKATGDGFNDLQVQARKEKVWADVVAEFEQVHAQVRAAAARVSPEAFRATGTLPWYGMAYALDDYIVYTSYGHKREHIAQIAVFREQGGRAESSSTAPQALR